MRRVGPLIVVVFIMLGFAGTLSTVSGTLQNLTQNPAADSVPVWVP